MVLTNNNTLWFNKYYCLVWCFCNMEKLQGQLRSDSWHANCWAEENIFCASTFLHMLTIEKLTDRTKIDDDFFFLSRKYPLWSSLNTTKFLNYVCLLNTYLSSVQTVVENVRIDLKNWYVDIFLPNFKDFLPFFFSF